MADTIVPITALSPTSAPPADAAIRAVVSLIWPFSSSNKQCALLLADPDIRLRNKKGQVRVRFSGPSAEAIALGKLGIGDEVLLELRGAVWAESDSDAVRTPGRSVDGELCYAGEVGLQKTGGEWIRADQNRPPPMEEGKRMQTPAAHNGLRMDLSRFGPGTFSGSVPIYSSPAFIRRARLSGSEFGNGYDPFTGEYDDLEAEAPRKRARISFGNVGKWKLAGRTPTPEIEDNSFPQSQAEVDGDVDMEIEGDGRLVEGLISANDLDKDVAPPPLDFAEAPEMAPPTLPRLQMPELPSSPASGTSQTEDTPSTPNLRPVPSSTLPLPSPFPTEAQAANATAERTSQQSFALAQFLPETADPDDESSPTGIYAHNSAIEGTYREHVAHPEFLSDTEEDEGLYEEHMRTMREEGLRDDYNYDDDGENGDGHEMDGDDVEEVIEDMGEEPEESSDEDEDGSEGEKTSENPSIINVHDDIIEGHERAKAAETMSQQMPSSNERHEIDEAEQAAAHLPPADVETITLHRAGIAGIPQLTPASSTNSITPGSRKRKSSQPATVVPQTPAKIPAGILGMDGTVKTPQSTPQSERDRIMARTYSSLFGFSDSPAPPQPFAQTPTPSGVISNMGRVKLTSEAGPGSASGNEIRTAEVGVPETSPKRVKSVDMASLDRSAQPQLNAAEVEESAGVDLLPAPFQKSSVVQLSSQSQEADSLSKEATVDVRAAEAEDVTMDTSSISHTSSIRRSEPVGTAADAQSTLGEDFPAAILEAAIEGDIDSDTHDRAERNVMRDAAEAPVAPSPPVAASSPSQIEIIDFDSSDGQEETIDVVDESHQSPIDPYAIVDAPDAPAFPGSPTEIDSEENDNGMNQSESLPAQAAAAEDDEGESAQNPIEEAKNVEVESSQDLTERVIPETLQTQDVQSTHPNDSQSAESFFGDQMPIAEEPQMPATQPSNSNISSHYFSFQSTTSVESTFAEETPKADATEGKTKTEVIELLSSSPAAELHEPQSVDAVLRQVEDDAHATEDDEQMSDVELISPELSSLQHDDVVGRKSLREVADGIRQASIVVKDDGQMLDAERSSDAAEHDEHVSDAEGFSPELSGVQNVLPVMPVETALLDNLGNVGVPPIDFTGFNQRQSERPSEPTNQLSYPTLPMSPEDSQIDRATQLLPPVPPPNETAFPPTPQLTQGDSLLKEVETVVEPAVQAPAQLDPPSRHTRSSVDPNTVEIAQSRNVTPDPPSRHTRSSVDPAAVDAAPPTHVTPDPPSKHTRSSVEPTAEQDKESRSSVHKTPTRSSKRLSLTHNQVPEKIVEQQTLQQEEEEDTIAVISPHQGTPVRKSPRKMSTAFNHEAEANKPELSPHKRSPAKKSLTSRLSHVPDVISAWFSPRRSTRLHLDEEQVAANAAAVSQQSEFRGLSTAMGYYTPLSTLNQRTNSQARADNTVDVIAIVYDSTKAPERAKTGPKDYFTCFKIWDPSLGPESSTLVEVFRPWKATLPSAEVGDVVLLRGFTVKSRKRQPYLISSETCGWCVWKYAEHDDSEGRKGKKRAVSFSGIREEIKGPPVELGQEERDRVGELREAWEKSA